MHTALQNLANSLTDMDYKLMYSGQEGTILLVHKRSV